MQKQSMSSRSPRICIFLYLLFYSYIFTYIKNLKKPVGVPFLCLIGPVKIEEDRKRKVGEI